METGNQGWGGPERWDARQFSKKASLRGIASLSTARAWAKAQGRHYFTEGDLVTMYHDTHQFLVRPARNI